MRRNCRTGNPVEDFSYRSNDSLQRWYWRKGELRISLSYLLWATNERVTMTTAPQRRLRLVLLITAMLAGSLVVGTSSADAICTPNAATATYSSPDGVVRARERAQYLSTCDGDNIYKGQLQDPVTDGSCSWATYEDANQSSVPVVACTTGVYKDYTWFDQNGDSFAIISLCWNGGCSARVGTHGY